MAFGIKIKNKKTEEKEAVKESPAAANSAANCAAEVQEQPAAIEKSGEKAGPGRDALISFRRSMYSSKMIGSAEDLIPFAWRQPLKLSDKKKMSKMFKTLTQEQVAREMLMPVKQEP